MKIHFGNSSSPYTETCVKQLIQLITCCSIVVLSLQDALPVLNYLFLSQQTISSWHVWQLITSLFVIPSQHLSFSSVLDFLFAMTMLYSSGKLVAFAYGRKHFFSLFALGGITSGFAAWAAMYYTNTSFVFSETYPAILSLVIAWIMLLPYQNASIFPLGVISRHWLFFIAFLSTAVLNAAHGEYIRAISYCTAFLVGYMYSVMALKLSGPFLALHPFENTMKKFAVQLVMLWEWTITRRLR